MNQLEPIKETEQQIEAEAYLAQPEPGQWPRGVFYQDGYVLISNIRHIKSGRKLTSKQEERGSALTERLRAKLQARLVADGWRPVAQTKEGLPIWRPAGIQKQPVAPAPAQRAISEQETGIAPDLAGEVRYSKPIHRKTRPITFTCQWCRQTVTEQRFPSHTPLYCSNPACKKEATRVKTRERVAAYYKAHPGLRRKKKTS